MPLCPSCGVSNRDGRKFCAECGTALSNACAACGTANEPGERFCGECGASLAAQPPPAATVPEQHSPPVAAVAERRLVSVLFADLVGFTTLSESRDAEEVRELLSSYFDRARTLIERYGGTVEKFIGDAVMAVWGAPVAQEDDAERAVRAALDLVAAVAELGIEAGAPGLEARAGVLTGDAAVTLGAQGQGMVAGDLVNTASRIQSAAEPGTVLVGEATRRATEAAIAYADAGEHELKGKAEPVALSRALRVTAARRGALRSAGLEPPFVGRDRELRLVKELFHACGEEQRAQLVSLLGIAGIGKSRLAWEFEKYVDGLLGTAWWHRGRCLAYGEGVTYWALAEMVRMRAQIAEAEHPDSARAKLRDTVALFVESAEEREWIEPRLAHLLGLGDDHAHQRDDLFAAWRLLWERMADQHPVVMVFEDMQWADASLLDFVAHLLEWSKGYPIFVLVLARPELVERRPGVFSGARSMSLPLEPLPQTAMEALLAGLAPGLPVDLQARILERAEGVPLYAVETVRMLLDRGLLVREGDLYRPQGAIEDLEVPETLQALVASRLDGFSAEERRLLQDASVLGKTFTPQALAALGGDRDALEPLLTSLLRKEVLFVQADPRSPERGQYGFVQDLLKRVAYETLGRRERKARHLVAAEQLEASFGTAEQEVVEVVASHYLAAYEAAPDAEDAAEIRTKACLLLASAGERAASLGANDEAARYFEQAAELAEERAERATLLERAGRSAWTGARGDAARVRFEEAIALFEADGDVHGAARVSARLGEILWAEGHIDRAVQRMEASFAVLAGDEPTADLAALGAQLGRLLFFMGDLDRALERIEQALELAEALWLPEVLSQAMNTKSIILEARGRPEECLGLLATALGIALENDVPSAALRAYHNHAGSLYYRDRHEVALEQARAGVALARRIGDRTWELNLLEETVAILFHLGRWDEALELAREIPHREEFATHFSAIDTLSAVLPLHLARGEEEEARALLQLFEPYGGSPDVQERTAFQTGSAALLLHGGAAGDALAPALAAFGERAALGAMHPHVKAGFAAACEAALALGDLDRVDELLAVVRGLHAGHSTPSLHASASRFAARVAAARGDDAGAEDGFREASRLLRDVELPFPLAVCELEYAEWLAAHGRLEEAEPLRERARATFERLGATPWLERASAGRDLPVG